MNLNSLKRYFKEGNIEDSTNNLKKLFKERTGKFMKAILLGNVLN